jgi:uncharacterized membrane protein (Fun14 family)
MNYPKTYKLSYSKKYLQFFYTCCVLTLLVIWWFANYFLASILSVMVIFYGVFITKKIKNKVDVIVINKENLFINDKKIVDFEVVFSNNIWSSIKFKAKNSKNMNLLIFNDSCKDYDINHINKYLNFAIKLL